MIVAIWLRPVPSCCFVWNAAGGGLQTNSTTGGQDKRTDARGRYGVVVVGVFTCCALNFRAAITAITLLLHSFHRATPVSAEAQA